MQETDAARRIRARVELKADRPVVKEDIAIQVKSRVTVSGHVKTADGVPVSQARTALIVHDGSYGKETPAVLTDDEGCYELETESYRRIRLMAEAEGYAVTCSDPVYLDDRPTSVNLVLNSGATVRGHVVDPHGMPVPGAQVKAWTFLAMGMSRQYVALGDTVAGLDGTFALSGLPSGPIVRLQAAKEGYADSRARQIALSEGMTESEVVLTLRGAFSISGRVTDPNSGSLQGAHVVA